MPHVHNPKTFYFLLFLIGVSCVLGITGGYYRDTKAFSSIDALRDVANSTKASIDTTNFRVDLANSRITDLLAVIQSLQHDRDRNVAEIRKLQCQLESAQDQICSLNKLLQTQTNHFDRILTVVENLRGEFDDLCTRLSKETFDLGQRIDNVESWRDPRIPAIDKKLADLYDYAHRPQPTSTKVEVHYINRPCSFLQKLRCR